MPHSRRVGVRHRAAKPHQILIHFSISVLKLCHAGPLFASCLDDTGTRRPIPQEAIVQSPQDTKSCSYCEDCNSGRANRAIVVGQTLQRPLNRTSPPGILFFSPCLWISQTGCAPLPCAWLRPFPTIISSSLAASSPRRRSRPYACPCTSA